MFSKLALFAAATMAVFVAAAPAPGGIDNSCNVGQMQCCNQIQDAKSAQVTSLVGLLGLVTGPLTGQVGLGCSPITAIGVGSGSSCTAQPTCCSGNSFSGLLVIGCSPLNVNV